MRKSKSLFITFLQLFEQSVSVGTGGGQDGLGGVFQNRLADDRWKEVSQQ